MKKFILSVSSLVVLLFALYYVYYHMGFNFGLSADGPVMTFMKTDADTIYMERDGTYEPFEIRGVNLGVGIPGHFATDYAIDQETFLRWFQSIQDLGANTVRVYTILHDDFYDAFYEYNTAREEAGAQGPALRFFAHSNCPAMMSDVSRAILTAAGSMTAPSSVASKTTAPRQSPPATTGTMTCAVTGRSLSFAMGKISPPSALLAR